MDRGLVYPGSIPLETDILNANRNAMVGLAKLSGALFGTGVTINGLAVVPTAPASLQVNVTPGEMYSLQNLDSTAYSSLAADTAHQIVKQGILLNQATLNCTAPATAGQSINYLIQATYADVDGGPVALPYYNASNPSVAWSGPNNTGTQQNTVRAGALTLSVKAGTAAPTGSQTTPAADAGYTALYVVTVANGQSQITATSIAKLYAAPYLPTQGVVGNLRASVVQLAGSVSLLPAQGGQLIEMSTTNGTVTLPTPTPALQGLTYYLSAPLTATMTVATPVGAFYCGGLTSPSTFQLTPSMCAVVVCDGANWVILSLSNGASSVVLNGYYRFANGLILQWGVGNVSGTSGTFNFPIAFTAGNCFMMNANDYGSTTKTVACVGISNTQFNVFVNAAGPTNFCFFAIGM